MTRVFIELYLDEDVDILIADLLRARGFVVTTVQDEHNLGMEDADHLNYAASQDKTIMTHNRDDFENLARYYFETNQSHSGIIIAVRRPPHEIVSRLMKILNFLTADEMQNQLIYI